MTPVATIRHNDTERTDRVTLYTREDSRYVWAAAADEEPYKTDVRREDIDDAWGSQPVWDLQYLTA